MFAGGVHYRFGVPASKTGKKVLVDLEKLALELVRPEGLASSVCKYVREAAVFFLQRRCCRGVFSRARLGKITYRKPFLQVQANICAQLT